MSGLVSGVVKVVSSIIGIATSLVGSIVGAFVKMPDYSQPTFEGDESPTFGFGPARNTVSKDLPVPVIYGKHRVAGNVIHKEMLPARDNNAMILLVVGVGEGPIQSISDPRVNNLSWDEYQSEHKGWAYWLGSGSQSSTAPDGGTLSASMITEPFVTTDMDVTIPEQPS